MSKAKTAKQKFIIVATWVDCPAEFITEFEGTEAEVRAFIAGWNKRDESVLGWQLCHGDAMLLDEAIAEECAFPKTADV